jgi:hypothetical protein
MKICSYNSCVSPVFGTDKNTRIGYCKNHQFLRTDKTPKSGRKDFRFAKRPHTKPSLLALFPIHSQQALFSFLWQEKKKSEGRVICNYTGENLDIHSICSTSLWFCCFAHILPKKNYPYFILNPDNIRVVSPEFHRIVDQGSSIDRAKHPDWKFDIWDQEVIKMKEKYKVFKKENLLS